MKRLLLGLLLLAAAVGAVLAVTEVARDREYGRLVADGDSALAEGRPLVAIEAFSGAIALRRDSMLAYLRRGEAYQQLGDLESALRDLRVAARLDPTATRPLERLGDVHYRLDHFARAADRYAEYVGIDDRSPRVLYKLGLSRYRDGKPLAGIAPLRQALALNERLPEVHYLLGLCLAERGQVDEARSAWGRAIELAPALAVAREQLAASYRAEGNHRRGIEQLETLNALEATPERAVALGLAYAEAGRTDQAVTTLGRAVERAPDQLQLYVALGRVWLDTAEARDDRVALNKAIEALEHVVAAAPATSEALTLMGRALLLAGNTQLAERMLQQAVDRFPIDSQAFKFLAEAARRERHFVVARDALAKHLALDVTATAASDRVETTLQIADLSLLAGEPAAAARWLREAATGRPGDIPILRRLAEAELSAGNPEGARLTIDRGLEQAPNDPTLLALRRRLP